MLKNRVIDLDSNYIFPESIGIDWIFARLDRDKKEIIRDSKIYRVPEELNRVVSILIEILEKDFEL